MALVHMNFFSKTMGMSRNIDVILPQNINGIGQSGSTYSGDGIPVLYLLHGLSDDQTTWQRRTSIERYAVERGLAVILPAAERSFYTNMKYGYPYFSYIGEELPEVIHELIPAITMKREKTFIAGLSMGGYGALKIGTSFPERFSYVGALSSAIDVVKLYQNIPDEKRIFDADFGSIEELRNSRDNIYYLFDSQIKSGCILPKYYMICGTEDPLHEDNLKFVNTYKDRLNLKYYEEPGIHEWAFWDKNIVKILDWLPLKGE
jgi:putative tributyrin esterase